MVEKFDVHRGSYWNNYFNRDREFYETVKSHLDAHIGHDTRGMSLGAGPGCEAVLLHDIGKRTHLWGIEPSQTHFDGEELSQKLREDDSSVMYTPRQVDMSQAGEFCELDQQSLDYILIIRSLHEIAESLGSKEQLRQELIIFLDYVKRGGKLVLGDVQYNDEISRNSQEHQRVIEEVKRYQRETIGHCHDPQDYIREEELQNLLSDYRRLRHETLENDNAKNWLIDQGINVENSPLEFFVSTFEVA
jgi:hypothetical protein